MTKRRKLQQAQSNGVAAAIITQSKQYKMRAAKNRIMAMSKAQLSTMDAATAIRDIGELRGLTDKEIEKIIKSDRSKK